jgi:hypothetical protein
MDFNTIVGLMLEVTALLGIPPVNDVPSITTVAQYQLECGKCSALYQRNVIKLTVNTWDDNKLKSILVHELTHHVQEMTGRYGQKPSCYQYLQREREAYSIQNQWNQMHGTSRYIFYYPGTCNEDR